MKKERKKEIADKRNLNYLCVEKSGIKIPGVFKFSPRNYFKQRGKKCRIRFWTSRIWMSKNFKKIILNLAPEVISLKPITLDKLKLKEYMLDKEIIKELGNPEPYSIAQVLVILRKLAGKQPRRYNMPINNDYYVDHIFYVNVGGRTVIVYACWKWWITLNYHEWQLRCAGVGESYRWRWSNYVLTPTIAGS